MYTFDHDLFLALNFDGGTCLDRAMLAISGTPLWIPLYLLVFWLVGRRYGWRMLLLFVLLLAAAMGAADIVAILVVIVILLAVAALFRTQLISLVEAVFNKATTWVNTN